MKPIESKQLEGGGTFVVIVEDEETRHVIRESDLNMLIRDAAKWQEVEDNLRIQLSRPHFHPPEFME